MSVDGDQALKSLDGNLGLLKELAAIFAEDSMPLVADFRKAIAEKDAARAKLAAHSLKGLTSTFYAKSEVEQIAAMEQAASEENWELLAGASETLHEIVQGLIDEMRETELLKRLET